MKPLEEWQFVKCNVLCELGYDNTLLDTGLDLSYTHIFTVNSVQMKNVCADLLATYRETE